MRKSNGIVFREKLTVGIRNPIVATTLSTKDAMDPEEGKLQQVDD